MATTITSQLHGYEHGHHLLNSTAKISKADQAVIDRISDVAGPLRPGETFSPYLTGYPLPSGNFYVLARTWQDLSVPRAGCVRTLSLVIPVDAWAASTGLRDYLRVLDPGIMPAAAITTILHRDTQDEPLPPALNFAANELIEATFLEEAKPIVMLDTPDPELIAIRLLTALWPGMRKRFAVSTFALSPRKIEGRSFDLVFAPKDARSRYANWDGRRIDGRTSATTRHRWTQAIADRVFVEPHPELLNEEELRFIGPGDSSGAAVLRIALLWEELIGNLQRSPSAALGLLDIANSRSEADPATVDVLEPVIADAARRAVAGFSPSDAWEFIGALAKKTFGSAFAAALPSIGRAAGDLAAKTPSRAIAFVEQSALHPAVLAILPQIASGLKRGFGPEAEQALSNANVSVLSHLLTASAELRDVAVTSLPLIDHLEGLLPQLSATEFDEMKEILLPALANDYQYPVFAQLCESLTADELLTEVSHLLDINSLFAETFIPAVATRAREVKASGALRDVLTTRKKSNGRDKLIAATITSTTEDINWLLDQTLIDTAFQRSLLLNLLSKASPDIIASVFDREEILNLILQNLDDGAVNILLRATLEISLPLANHLAIVSRLLPLLPAGKRTDLLWRTLQRCLGERFDGDEVPTLVFLLNALDDQADGRRLVELGMGRHLGPALLSRNLVAYDSTFPEVRTCFLRGIDDIASALAHHYLLNIDQAAGSACTRLLFDAQALDKLAHLRASAHLLPALLRSGHSPVSSIVTATFPAVYCELAKEDDVPDLFRFIPFIDWDRCKSARRELVDAFSRSVVWSPADFALAGVYSGDLPRFLRKMAKAYDGERYIARIEEELGLLPDQIQAEVEQAILNLHRDWPTKYDWRD